ncbi:dinitrogenase iron-molybdenum cofactor biosynthesis protein [Dethiosulfovibrio sp. F2B]|uniref:NifB/NifX family molybdenum-iron cluster-binding protein n=1 Tax=Dethiosulfovibrio faecalis TaxID=2720018 RepID=UPI001F2C55CC|nr:NifB/NifX family molybdenum-iron cluster-binding protein [Dethiosulfovibrio faecalis]MCF4151669.1 dinitrogenase iron-molybdenum cofactor biosynthesis protein [Dethiosulfovibrio faecalis]MEA3285041.1 NifB/NifX family molybdenum-iron cluster-binding protein [Synergistota bacterium]
MYAVAAQGEGSEALVADRFGRAAYFVIFDEKGSYIKSLRNDTSSVAHGAGGQAVAMVASEGAKIVIGPQFGPNAESSMRAGGITAFSASGVSASEAVRLCIAGELKRSV